VSDEFVTVHEIAELLKVNQQTVRNWIDRGELAAVRVGARRVRVRRADLDAYLAAGEQESDESAAWSDVAAARGIGA
jgi:excisionase family DNA binding protein